MPSYGNEVATFGRVGTASSATISMNPWQVFGGITFDGNATGTTAYTLGSSSNKIQLASTNSSGVIVQATAASTASQAINAGIELWSNTTFSNNMTGGQLINLNGSIIGAGSLTVSGPGSVNITGSNSYTGGTIIGNAQEAAVLQANSNTALGTGGVVIGTAGNTTTARLEIGGIHTLSNNIDFRGRNNNTVGIESTNRDNILTGTISANVGGGNYIIQADDSASLTLTGSAAGATVAGVALQSNATGSRTFTLQSAGNGYVTGAIANGSAVVSIVKSGSGAWALNHANSYTGTTTVDAGTLSLGTANAIATTSQLVLNGGTLATDGLPQDFTTSATPASLAVGSTPGSALDLGFATTPTNVKFADSHSVSWTGPLTIQNWTYELDHLSFGASGLSTAQLSNIQFADFASGTSLVSASTAGATRAIGEVTPLIGDVNGDGHVDGADIAGLMQALSDTTTYQQDRTTGADGMPGSPTGIFTTNDVQFSLDINGDGQTNNADVQALITLLANNVGAGSGSGAVSTVPEPASCLLFVIGLIIFPAIAHRTPI